MSKIVRHSYGIKSDRDELELNRQSYADRKRRDDEKFNKGVNDRIAVKESRTSEETFVRNTLDRDTLQRKAGIVSNTILAQGKSFVFKSLVTECFKDALWLDEYFVTENSQRFDELVSEYVDEHGGFAMLEAAVKANPKVAILREMKKVCEATAKGTTTRIIRDMNDNPELAEFQVFEMNEEEKDELYGKRAELSLDKLADLVKTKVLTVVKDERDRQSKEKELLDDLEAKAKSVTDEGGTVKESTRMGESRIKESTLFNSIFQNSLYEATVAVKEHFVSEEEEDDDDEEGFDSNLTTNKLNGAAPTSDQFTSPVRLDVDMDLIMCEAVTYYTLMELTHTMCLESFQRADIQRMSHKMLNRK